MVQVAKRGNELLLPGLATAHSHAFQRALRGRTERLPVAADDATKPAASFWSWRDLMYQVARKLDPETIHAISHFAFVELAAAGVTAVGEFHYVHHQPDGTPYADRTAMADAVVRAALDAGLRIALLRVVYERGGSGLPPEAGQRRFVDRDSEAAFRDLETLTARYGGDERVRFGLAPHSVRAVTRDAIAASAAHAAERGLPFHMHVAEQRREIAECVAEHGRRPVELLDELGVLDGRFVAVHATHLGEGEASLLGRNRSFACICRTTERNLGDGSPDILALRDAGARLCVGVDSHATSDPFEDARAIELDERTRAERRVAAAEAHCLLEALSREGYAAIGMDGAETADIVILDALDPALLGIPDELLVDGVVFAAGTRAIRQVHVAGQQIVDGGVHVGYDAARTGYLSALRTLGL